MRTTLMRGLVLGMLLLGACEKQSSKKATTPQAKMVREPFSEGPTPSIEYGPVRVTPPPPTSPPPPQR